MNEIIKNTVKNFRNVNISYTTKHDIKLNPSLSKRYQKKEKSLRKTKRKSSSASYKKKRITGIPTINLNRILKPIEQLQKKIIISP